jgi:hypothetical protein
VYRTSQEEELWFLPCAVTGFGSLQESLDSFFGDETLEGQNQILAGGARLDGRCC